MNDTLPKQQTSDESCLKQIIASVITKRIENLNYKPVRGSIIEIFGKLLIG